MRRPELIVIGVMLVAALLAFPAFRDVELIHSIAISICSGLGF